MNKNYLNYLFKTNKPLIIFCFLLQVLVTLTSLMNLSAISALWLLFTISTIMSFVLPVLFLSHADDKKAVDSFFSLPVKRSQMLITILLFCGLLIIVPYTFVYALLFVFGDFVSSQLLYCLLISYVGIVVLLIFNAGIFLLGNTIVDGLICLGAYYLFAPVLMLFVSSLSGAMSYGTQFEVLPIIDKTSFIVNYIEMFSSKVEMIKRGLTMSEFNMTAFVLTAIIYLLIGLFSLRNNYVLRKAERAGTISDRFFAYPFLIYVFTTLVIYIIVTSSSPSNHSIIGIVEDNLLTFIIVMFLYTVATFVYKRKIRLNIKSLMYFVLIFFSAVGLLKVIYNTDGFGISYNYEKNPENMRVGIYLYNDTDVNKEIRDILDKNKISYDEIDIIYEFELDNNDIKNKQEVLNFINNKRDESIHNYFQNGHTYLGTLNITSNMKYTNGWYQGQNYWYQNCKFTMDDLKYMNDNAQEVIIEVYKYSETDKEYQIKDYTLNELLSMEVK